MTDKKTCDGCINYNGCLLPNNDLNVRCLMYKDESKFIELPCKLGEDCYKVLSELKMIVKSKLETVDLIGDVIDGLITTDKAEAEAKLKELNNEGEKK